MCTKDNKIHKGEAQNQRHQNKRTLQTNTEIFLLAPEPNLDVILNIFNYGWVGWGDLYSNPCSLKNSKEISKQTKEQLCSELKIRQKSPPLFIVKNVDNIR